MPTFIDTPSVKGLTKNRDAIVTRLPVSITDEKKDIKFRDCHHDFSISSISGKEKIKFRGEDLKDIQDSFKSLDNLIAELSKPKIKMEIAPDNIFSKIEIDAIKGFLLQLKPDIDLDFTLRFSVISNPITGQETTKEEDDLNNLLI